VDYVKEVRKKEDGTYIVRLEEGEVAAPIIIEHLRQRGYHVMKLSISKPTLDEVFLTYTGRAMRDSEESEEAVMSRRIMLRRARR